MKGLLGHPLHGAATRRRRELGAQVRWFNRLRFLVVAGMAVLTYGASTWLPELDDAAPLYALCAFTLAVNLTYVAWFRRLQGEGGVRRHVLLQIGIDLAILTLVLHFSGGVTNPLVLFYTFHTFIASMLLSARIAALVAVVSALLIALLGVGEYAGWIPHHPLRSVGLFEVAGLESRALAVWILTLATVLAVTVYFVSTILARLRSSERELAGLSEQLALSEKLASIGTLAAGVSHEINNPIGVIANKTDILRCRIDDGDDEVELLREIDTIDRHVGRVRSITEGLLAFARETPFELRPADLGDVVREAAELVKVSYRQEDVTLEVAPPPGRLLVRASVNHLLQVLVNVLLNARDASTSGAGVRVSTRAVGESELVVDIQDHGEGIAPENLPKIFDPFFTTKEIDRGTGLGLALSHGLVERHGGRVEVESEQGVGTTFSICLPRAVSDAGP